VPFGRVAIALLALALFPLAVFAQYQPPSDYLQISADRASTWTDGPTNVVQLQGPITIQTDRAKLTADRAVIWLTPPANSILDQQRAEIALIGNASVEQPEATRTGDSLYVSTDVRGAIRITANERVSQNLSDSDLFHAASALRPLINVAPGAQQPQAQWIMQRNFLLPSTEPTTEPTSQPTTRPAAPVSFRAINVQTAQTPDDKVAIVLSGGVKLFQTRPNGDFVELQADRVVLFTPLRSIRDLSNTEMGGSVDAAYLEGDVQITFLPSAKEKSEQRMRAKRVYYDFKTDRAVLTMAVVHMIEVKSQTPLIVRAHFIRQLSLGEYQTEGVQLTTSSFSTPSYELHSDRAYIRQSDTGDPRLGQRTVFVAHDNTFKAFNIPLFYWPYAAGSMTDRGMALRELLFGSSRGFGPGVRTDFGFFESIGQPPPQDLDISYRLDYFNDRGPAVGVDSTYGGGFITDTTKQPWDFSGDFTSYFVNDHGLDRLGADRHNVQPDETFRYHVLWEHQHIFPDNWQLQIRAGVVSDPTFLEEWFRKDFDTGLPHDVSAYLKHQQQTEAFTFLVDYQPNNFVTTSDELQEQFEVERLPEFGYYRIGDSFGQDQFTFFSANTLSNLHFKESNFTITDLGFRSGQSPGLPALGTTGLTSKDVDRGDFRQEVDYPINAGQFRLVPYVMGRYTGYDDSPDGSTQNRLFVGTGLRITTAFWKVDDTAYSDLFDIHRVRHVIEPEINFFTSASTVNRDDVFVYDESVDPINNISAVQLALNQRWQTKRGGAGQWRSVDFFTFNVEANFFAHQPSDADLEPRGFRGLFFPSVPEESIPRNSVNADALWRISDSTALFYDIDYNLDRSELATTSIGIALQRGSRLSYFIGTRYIGDIDSTIASFSSFYELSAKYSISLAQSVDLDQRRTQNSSVTLTRNFDRFFMTFGVFYDAVDKDSGFRFGIFPTGLAYGLNSAQVQNAVGGQNR
jgi:lipopolysaccharide export system protein LptA